MELKYLGDNETAGGYFLNRLIMMLNTILTISIEVTGKNTLLCRVSIRISPGSFPNQLSNQGAKYSTTPIASITTPAITNQRAICSIRPVRRSSGYMSEHYQKPITCSSISS